MQGTNLLKYYCFKLGFIDYYLFEFVLYVNAIYVC